MSSVPPRHLYGKYDACPPHTRAYLWDPVLRYLSDLPAASVVLDAGCGNGAFARALIDKQFDVCGVDLEPSGVAEARKLNPGGRFAVSSVYDDLRAVFGCTFDAVVALEVIEHLYDPRAFVGRVHECL